MRRSLASSHALEQESFQICDFRFEIEQPTENLRPEIFNLKLQPPLLVRDHASYFRVIAVAH